MFEQIEVGFVCFFFFFSKQICNSFKDSASECQQPRKSGFKVQQGVSYHPALFLCAVGALLGRPASWCCFAAIAVLWEARLHSSKQGQHTKLTAFEVQCES